VGKVKDMKKILDMAKQLSADGRIAAKQSLMEHYPDMTDLKWEADQIIILFNDGSKKQFSHEAFLLAKRAGQHVHDFVDSIERVYPIH
jgi:hypothetical protein